MNHNIEEIKRECHEYAFHANATAFIYNLKSSRMERRLQLITLLGFIVPVFIGAIVTSYGLTSEFSILALKWLTPLAVVQLVLSTLALVFKWDDKKQYFLESAISNRQLRDNFLALAKSHPADLDHYRNQFNILIVRNSNREDQDDKYPFSDKETRKGMRHSLRQYQRECVGCKTIPLSMESTDCPVCGNFKFKMI